MFSSLLLAILALLVVLNLILLFRARPPILRIPFSRRSLALSSARATRTAASVKNCLQPPAFRPQTEQRSESLRHLSPSNSPYVLSRATNEMQRDQRTQLENIRARSTSASRPPGR